MKSFLIATDDIKYSSKAISLPIGRNGKYPVIERCWFPLSEIDVYERRNPIVEIHIPEWLLNQKCSDGCSIIEFF